MLSKETKAIVKATAPVLKEHGEKITQTFYNRMFENHPELKDMFNMSHQRKGTQPRALAHAVLQYAIHIDELEKLGPAVETIAQKHSSLSVTEDMYPIVGKFLLEAIKEVLKEAATPQIIDAWAEAYEALAVIFIKKEEALYSEKEHQTGGFRGKKEFQVVDKKEESNVITSFYLKRKDGMPVPEFKAGQYVAITVEIPGTSHKHTRTYSLSDQPSKDYLRISVKKEAGNPDGLVSNYLHDHLQTGDVLKVGMPAGTFIVQPGDQPLVLIAGGVGITPLMSMFYEQVKKYDREVIFIQCALNSATHVFKEEIKANLNPQSKAFTVYSKPLASDRSGTDYDFEGLLTADMLKEIGVSSQSDFYFCGPKPFMASVLRMLRAFKVPEEQINYEFFGPEQDLLEERVV